MRVHCLGACIQMGSFSSASISSKVIRSRVMSRIAVIVPIRSIGARWIVVPTPIEDRGGPAIFHGLCRVECWLVSVI